MDEKKEKKKFFILMGFILIGVIILLVFEDGTRIRLEKKYNSLEKITIDSDLANIEVKYIGSDDINIVVYGKKRDEIIVSEGNKSLKLSKKSSRSFCLLNCDDKIILYLPKYFKYLNIKTDLGNVDTREVNFEEIIIYSNVGKINIGNVNEVIINNEIGDTYIKEIDAKGNSTISTNTGNVTINNIKNLNVNAESVTGKVNVSTRNDDSNEYVIDISSEIGDIKVR